MHVLRTSDQIIPLHFSITSKFITFLKILLMPVNLSMQLTMAQRLCLLLTITAWAGGAAEQSPYCSFSPEHTLCRASGLGPTCGSQVPERGVSVKDAALILTLHNQLRTRVAMGKESQGAPGPQPHAANMRLMVGSGLYI